MAAPLLRTIATIPRGEARPDARAGREAGPAFIAEPVVKLRSLRPKTDAHQSGTFPTGLVFGTGGIRLRRFGTQTNGLREGPWGARA